MLVFSSAEIEFIVFEAASSPLTRIQIKYAASLVGELRIAWKYPTAVKPRSNCVFVPPTPQKCCR
jgi:hypothetical protein